MSRLWVTLLLCVGVHADDDLFEMRVRPVLAAKCFMCHTDSKMGGLQLDTREHFLKGGKSGPIAVAGDPEKSLIVKAVRYTDAKLKMPPTGKLSDAEIAAITEWVKSGAAWPEHESKAVAAPAYKITPEQRAFWAFQPIRNPAPPQTRNAGWVRSPIDRFVLANLEGKGLAPVGEADKRTLIRRATFDLTGLPPTAEEVAAFERDDSAGAFARVVDRLLASPRYGERWGRIWLDVARYSDDRLNSERDDPYENSFRYRDWVIQAIQDDMPYDVFVKAQIAGDLLPGREKYEAGLGFYALSPEMQDDRVDATTRGFLALTVGCAQCHDHKYDPIPARDYYSLLGIFRNTELHEIPLAPKDAVERYQEQKKRVDKEEAAIKDFAGKQSEQLGEIQASRTARYMLATIAGAAKDAKLDAEIVERWGKYLGDPKKDHPFLKPWFAGAEPKEKLAAEFQELVLQAVAEKKRIDDENHVRLGLNPTREDLSNANLISMERDKFVLWEDLLGSKGVFHFGDDKIDRFLSMDGKDYLETMRAHLAEMKKALPAKYAFLHAIEDKKKPEEQRVWLRGSQSSPGEPAPPHFLTILSAGEPRRFSKGRERLELADAIASPSNPLTARVIVNRVWQQHFGKGIVATPSNFGTQGGLPTHPELLDYLALRFMDEGWSLKKLHREMMLTAAYALSSGNNARNDAADPENRLLWRFSTRRLDAEALRDSLLFVTGALDLKQGGPAVAFTKDNRRRTVYSFISRRRLDPMLALFDFPNPNNTSEQRMQTTVPLQKLFFMNSDFVMERASALAQRSGAGDTEARIREAYSVVYQRAPSGREMELGASFLKGRTDAWAEYMQVLLASNEFSFVN